MSLCGRLKVATDQGFTGVGGEGKVNSAGAKAVFWKKWELFTALLDCLTENILQETRTLKCTCKDLVGTRTPKGLRVMN